VAIRPSSAWRLRPGLFLLRKVSLRLRGSPQGQSHHGSIDDRIAGRPFTFSSGHQLRVIHPHAGIWSRNEVPIEQIRPLLFWHGNGMDR